MNMDKLHLGISLNGQHVFIQSVKNSRNGVARVEGIVDRTDEFLVAMVEYLQANKGRVELYEGKHKKYIITLEEVEG